MHIYSHGYLSRGPIFCHQIAYLFPGSNYVSWPGLFSPSDWKTMAKFALLDGSVLVISPCQRTVYKCYLT